MEELKKMPIAVQQGTMLRTTTSTGNARQVYGAMLLPTPPGLELPRMTVHRRRIGIGGDGDGTYVL